jgi:hypothetical protein
VRFEYQPHALALEDGEQFLHRPPELASLAEAASGLPLNSEFITFAPRSTATWMARFQYRTAAWRSSSSGPDHRYSGSTEATCTPAASRVFLNAAICALSARGCRKNGRKSSRGDSSIQE